MVQWTLVCKINARLEVITNVDFEYRVHGITPF